MKAIETTKLSKRFGKLDAVQQVSFFIDKGEILGLLGANGAGKTTLIRMLCGMLAPSGGEGWVNGYNIHSQAKAIRYQIGYMSQSVSLLETLTVKENVVFYGRIHGMEHNRIENRWEELSDLYHLGRYRDKQALALPSGVRQVLAFAVAIFHQPGILFLDEPTSGLDPMSRMEIWKQIYRLAYHGTTVVISTHYLDESYYCDRLLLMEEGRIKRDGSPESFDALTGGKGLQHLFFM
jgi:ABC-2 type transport system ATP-binding protein